MVGSIALNRGTAVADDESPEQPTASKKQFILKIRERKAIPTSQGTYYVRHLVTRDLHAFSAYCDHTVEPIRANLIFDLSYLMDPSGNG